MWASNRLLKVTAIGRFFHTVRSTVAPSDEDVKLFSVLSIDTLSIVRRGLLHNVFACVCDFVRFALDTQVPESLIRFFIVSTRREDCAELLRSAD